MAIEEARKKIDEIDLKLLDLLNQRAEISKKIGEEKRAKQLPVYDAARERQVLDSLLSKNKGLLPRSAVEAVFTEVISASRSLEKPLRVAFLGPETTFTHMAAIKKFGSSAEMSARGSISAVFNAVEKGEVDFGVVPVENSTEGTVSHTLDMFLDAKIGIVGEIALDVSHNLVSKYALHEIKKLYTHPQALAQCRRWIDEHLPGVEVIDASSTAAAAEQAAVYLKSAAIASEMAAKKYGLNVVAKGIEDIAQNVTRFLVIGKSVPVRTGKDKTSIVFSVKHRPGALFEAMKPFQKYNINLTKIESRPAKGKAWEYVFFIDFQGFATDEKAKKALAELERACSFVRVIGSYPEEAVQE